jgi:hypothetical protein
MFCNKRNDTYRCLKEIDDRSVLANIYLSNLLKLEKEQEEKTKLEDEDEKTKLEDEEEKTKLEDEEEKTKLEDEDEKTKLEILVVEDKNPCCDSIYDTNKVQFEYTFEYPSLIAIRKGVCFKCSTYKSILYSNVDNYTSSQMCQDCISIMFNDFKK